MNQVDNKLKILVESKSLENEQNSHEKNISKDEKEISNICSISRSEFIKMQQAEGLENKPKGKIKLSIENDIIYRIIEDQQGNCIDRQLFVPKALRRKVIELAHDAKMSRHLGIKQTRDRIKTCFYWTAIDSEIRRYCKSCLICQKTTTKGRGG